MTFTFARYFEYREGRKGWDSAAEVHRKDFLTL